MSGPISIDTKNAAEMAKAVKNGDLPAPAKTLAEALARIYADGGRYVQKTGQMQGTVRYTYAKEGDFIAIIRPLMEAHGVTIRPKTMKLVSDDAIETQSQNGIRRQYRTVIRVTFELLHTSGDRLEVQTFGEGIDSGDKSYNKAMTGAMKYALRQTFCVETGDDPDYTPSHEQERAPANYSDPSPAKYALHQMFRVETGNDLDDTPSREQKRAPANYSDPSTATKANPALRAKYAQQLAMCSDRPALDAIFTRIRDDVKAGVLGEEDRLALRKLCEETVTRLPKTN